MNIAFIGLGVMGYPMAGHLARAGHRVTVFNRTTVRAAQWVTEYAGHSAPSPADAARDADLVFTCVGNDADVAEVVLGPRGALSAMRPASVLVDHTTASAGMARQLATRCSQQQVGFLDAPVSGGEAGARSGQLTIMCGSEPEPYSHALPVLNCYAKSVRLMGPAGSGQLTKMVNQICVAGLLQGLSEGMHFAEQAGLDVPAVMEVISGGAAQSWQMDHRQASMYAREFDFGFAVDWMRKDLNIVLEEAGNNGAQLPVTRLVDQFYAEIQAMGGGRWDTSSLIQRLAPGGGVKDED